MRAVCLALQNNCCDLYLRLPSTACGCKDGNLLSAVPDFPWQDSQCCATFAGDITPLLLQHCPIQGCHVVGWLFGFTMHAAAGWQCQLSVPRGCPSGFTLHAVRLGAAYVASGLCAQLLTLPLKPLLL